MNLKQSDAYRRFLVLFVAVDIKSTRIFLDQSFSVAGCVRLGLARMSERSYDLLCSILFSLPERTKNEWN